PWCLRSLSVHGTGGRSAGERLAVPDPQSVGGGCAGGVNAAYNLPSMAFAVFWIEPTRDRTLPVSPLIPVIRPRRTSSRRFEPARPPPRPVAFLSPRMSYTRLSTFPMLSLMLWTVPLIEPALALMSRTVPLIEWA